MRPRSRLRRTLAGCILNVNHLDANVKRCSRYIVTKASDSFKPPTLAFVGLSSDEARCA
jgi:hypothetical protein